MRILFATGCLLVACTCPCQSALIAFDFTGTNPGQHRPWNTGTVIDPNASTAGFNFVALSGETGNNRFNASGWATSVGGGPNSGILNNTYFGFVIAPASGYDFDLNSAAISFTLQMGVNGPPNYSLMSSIGGFTTGSPRLQDGALSGTDPIPFTFTFPSSGFNDIAAPVEFRIYGYNAATAGGAMSVNALSLDGAVTPVPEPSTLIMVSLLVIPIGISIFRTLRKIRTVKRHW